MTWPADVDLAGDGGGDQGGTVFLKMDDGGFNLGDDGVDLGGLAVEVDGDGALFLDWWTNHGEWM